MKKKHYLWQLHNIEKDIDKITEDLSSEKGNRQDVMHELDHFETEADQKKKHERYIEEIAVCEKKISKKSARLNERVSYSQVFFFYVNSDGYCWT